MKEIKKLIVRFLFVGEIALFTGYYVFGAHGRHALIALEQQNAALKAEIGNLKGEVKQVQKEVNGWLNNPSHKEKFAREYLQMAYPDEDLYRYPKN